METILRRGVIHRRKKFPAEFYSSRRSYLSSLFFFSVLICTRAAAAAHLSSSAIRRQSIPLNWDISHTWRALFLFYLYFVGWFSFSFRGADTWGRVLGFENRARWILVGQIYCHNALLFIYCGFGSAFWGSSSLMSQRSAPVGARRTISPLHPCEKIQFTRRKSKKKKIQLRDAKNILLVALQAVCIPAGASSISHIFKVHESWKRKEKSSSCFRHRVNELIRFKNWHHWLKISCFTRRLWVWLQHNPMTDANEGGNEIIREWCWHGGRGLAFKLATRSFFFNSEGSTRSPAGSSLPKTEENFEMAECLWRKKGKKGASLCSHQLKPWLQVRDVCLEIKNGMKWKHESRAHWV